MSKKIIINADDYGICPEVNRAIENLIRSEKLQNVSVLANGLCYEDTIGFLLDNISCSVGIHLNTVEGVSLSKDEKINVLLDKNGQFVGLTRILSRWLKSPIAVSKAIEIEWRKQIERLLNDRIRILHADSHQHLHAFPPFWRIIVKLCYEYDIPCLRIPAEQNSLKIRSIPAFALRQSANLAQILSPQKNLITNHHFLGFKRAGSYGESEMIEDLENLSDGITEIIVHPSISEKIPYPHFNGEIEYKALAGTKLWEKIKELNIQLVSWEQIAKSRGLQIKNKIVYENH